MVVYLSICHIHPSIHPSIYPQVWKSIDLSINLSICASLKTILNFWSLQHQKRSTSARLPRFLNLATSKTKQFRETSFNNGKLSALRPCANAFCVFSRPCLWSIAPATKKWSQVIRSVAPVTRNNLPKTEDLMLQNATPPRKSAPWPPNISDDHVSCNVVWPIVIPCQ